MWLVKGKIDILRRKAFLRRKTGRLVLRIRGLTNDEISLWEGEDFDFNLVPILKLEVFSQGNWSDDFKHRSIVVTS